MIYLIFGIFLAMDGIPVCEICFYPKCMVHLFLACEELGSHSR